MALHEQRRTRPLHGIGAKMATGVLSFLLAACGAGPAPTATLPGTDGPPLPPTAIPASPTAPPASDPRLDLLSKYYSECLLGNGDALVFEDVYRVSPTNGSKYDVIYFPSQDVPAPMPQNFKNTPISVGVVMKNPQALTLTDINGITSYLDDVFAAYGLKPVRKVEVFNIANSTGGTDKIPTYNFPPLNPSQFRALVNAMTYIHNHVQDKRSPHGPGTGEQRDWRLRIEMPQSKAWERS